MPEQWNNFFVMVGGGAAALAGLIFVAMSINHEIIFRNTTHEQLCKLGIENIVVHPGDIPRTDKEKKNKTDIHDSRSLVIESSPSKIYSY